MVIVFATVVFTGSIIKGARDRVGGLSSKTRSIKSEQESRRNQTGTRRIREVEIRLGMTEDQEKNDGKEKSISFQTGLFHKSQIRHRSKPPKTLRKELEEEGMLIDEYGEARIATEQLEERSWHDESSEVSTVEQIDNLKQIRITEEQQGETLLHDQCNEFKREVQRYNLKEDEADEINTDISETTTVVPNSGNIRSSRDDSSVTKDGQNSIKPHETEGSNDTVDQNLEEDKSLPSKQYSKVEAVEDGRKNILHVFKEEKDTLYNKNSNDSHNTDSNKAEIPPQPACSHVSRPQTGLYLSKSKQVDAPRINAGDTSQNQSKNEIHQTKDIISETGDFRKPTLIEPEEVSARNAHLGDRARVKHRSQKGMEGNPFLHLDTQENNASRKENAKIGLDTKEIAEGNSQQSKESSKDHPQPSAVQHIPTVTTKSDGTCGMDVVVNANYSAAQTSFKHSCDLQTLKNALIPLPNTVDLPDALDHVVDRISVGDGTLDMTQDCAELSEEPRPQNDKEISLEKSEDDEPVEQSPGSVSDKFLEYCTGTEPFICTQKRDDQEVPHRMRSCRDASFPNPKSDVKNKLHGFLEDFGVVDCVGAYWGQDDPRGKNSDAIVMAVENRDQQGKRTERCQLQERITKATEKLAAITRETERQEDRLLKLIQEVRAVRSESEKSEQKLQEEQGLYRESLLRCCKLEEDAIALEGRCHAVDFELQAMRGRKMKTIFMLKAARGEVKLLDHRIAKEQTLQEEQRDRRLEDKRRRFRRTSLKIDTLATLIVIQIILIIIALWRL